MATNIATSANGHIKHAKFIIIIIKNAVICKCLALQCIHEKKGDKFET